MNDDRLEESAKAADAAEDPRSFADAVSRELDERYAWLDHLPERMGRRADDLYDEIAQRRLIVHDELEVLREAPAEGFDELRTRIDEQREELGRLADELAERLRP